MSSVPERWLELRVRAEGPEQVERIPEVFLELGGRATVEQDSWHLTHVPEPDDVQLFVAEARKALVRAGVLDAVVETSWQEHEDWAETWKRGLAPRRITPRLVVRPSWTDFEAQPDDIVIVLDPGIAFGTAEHGTTRGCLRLLDGLLESGDTVLDVGSGSGILAVASVLLGAARVHCVEGDPYACQAALENAEGNGVVGRLTVEEAWATEDLLVAHGPVDRVVANIETKLLLPLVSGLVGAARPEGSVIVSGILDHEWDQMLDAMVSAGCRLERLDEDGEWRSGLFTRSSV